VASVVASREGSKESNPQWKKNTIAVGGVRATLPAYTIRNQLLVSLTVSKVSGGSIIHLYDESDIVCFIHLLL